MATGMIGFQPPPWAMMPPVGGMFSGPGIPPTVSASGFNITTPDTLSSPPIVKRALPIDYPDIDAWLASLDSDDVRGKKQLNFSQYIEKLHGNGILDLEDLLSLSLDQLQEFSGMNFGTANRVMNYAKDDSTDLRNDAKRARFD